MHASFGRSDILGPSINFAKEFSSNAPRPRTASCAYPETHPELYQLQTPPTRSSSVKRQPQRTESVVFDTPPSMLAGRHEDPYQRISFVDVQQQQLQQHQQQQTPLQQHRPQPRQPPYDPSPANHQPLDFSHSSYVFSDTSAPTVLAPPQECQPWPQSLQNGNPAGTVQAWDSLQDPFLTWLPQSTSGLPEQLCNTSAGDLGRTPGQSSGAYPVNASDNGHYETHPYESRTSPEKALPTTASVNPSLVYSSPTRTDTSEGTHSFTYSRPSAAASERRIPYDHSITDPRHELQSVRAARPRHTHAQNGSRSFVNVSSGRSELQRSNTMSSLHSNSPPGQNNTAHSGVLTRSNSAVSLPRRSSPLKRDRGSRASLSSISETPKPVVRTSVVLTVDSNGRAETRVVESSPTKSLRDKYPSLWENSNNDPGTPQSRSTSKWPSRNSSLVQRGEERCSKIAKLDPPLEDLEKLHLPRSNSSASLKTPSKAAYAAAAQLRRQSSAKKHHAPVMHTRRNTLASLNSSFESLASVDAATSERPEQGDAGSALRLMMASRASTSSASPVRPDPLHVGNGNSHPAEPEPEPEPPRKLHQKSQSFSAPAPVRSVGTEQPHVFPMDCAPMQATNVPPMHMAGDDMAGYAAAPMIRCVCNLPFDDGRGMLQCAFCAMWMHAACLSLDPYKLPPTYICSYCNQSATMLGPNVPHSYAEWGVAAGI